jgi:hypothetical protein
MLEVGCWIDAANHYLCPVLYSVLLLTDGPWEYPARCPNGALLSVVLNIPHIFHSGENGQDSLLS